MTEYTKKPSAPTGHDSHTPNDPLGVGAPSSAGDPSGETVPSLIKQLANDVSVLLSSEVALAKAEVREAAAEAKAGVSGLVSGAALLNAGLLMLVLGLVFLLATQIEIWLSAFIVGGIVLVIGAIMLKAGKAKFKPKAFTPDRTVNAVKADSEAAKRKVS